MPRSQAASFTAVVWPPNDHSGSPSLWSLDHVPLPNKNHSGCPLIALLGNPSHPGLGAALPAHWEGRPGSGFPPGLSGSSGCPVTAPAEPHDLAFSPVPMPACRLPPQVLAAPTFSAASERPFAAGLVEWALTGA